MPRARENSPLDRGAPPADVVPALLPTRISSGGDHVRYELDSLWTKRRIFCRPTS